MIGGPLGTHSREGKEPPSPREAATLCWVGCDLGSVSLAGWSLFSGPDRIIASNHMADYQLLVSV